MSAAAPSDPRLHVGDLEALLRRLLARLGHTLTRWSLRDVERTGAETTLLVETHVRTGGAAETERHLGLTTAILDPHAVAAADIVHGQCWSLWMHPHDPRLPGLARAVDPEQLRPLTGAAPLLALRMISYRPLRRAVLRADLGATAHTPARSIYLKVLPERLAELTATRHRLLESSEVPSAPVLAGPELGVLALGGLPGRSLATRLLEARAHPDDADRVLQMLDRLPHQAHELPARRGWAERLPEFIPRLTQLLPEHQHRWQPVVEQIRDGLTTEQLPEPVPVHGDLYEAHLLFDGLDSGTRITGVLDVDGLGPGHQIDDVACLLGHLAVLPTVDRRYRGATAVLQGLRQRLADAVTGPVAGSAAVAPEALRRRTAAVVLTLLPEPPVVYGTAREDAAERRVRELAQQRLSIAETILPPR